MNNKNIRLARKNAPLAPDALERIYGAEVEKKLRKNGYPTEAYELAILRKQISVILDALKESGIDVRTDEFRMLDSDAESAKREIRQVIDG